MTKKIDIINVDDLTNQEMMELNQLRFVTQSQPSRKGIHYYFPKYFKNINQNNRIFCSSDDCLKINQMYWKMKEKNRNVKS